jgi:hypothetical protein
MDAVGRKIKKVNKMKYRDENGKFISKEAWETMQEDENSNSRPYILYGIMVTLALLYIFNNMGRLN